MNYLDLDIIKQHLNLDASFTADDSLLEIYADASEKAIENYLDVPLHRIAADNDGELPKPLMAAILLMIGNLYLVRENISVANFTEVPNASKFILDPYISYLKTSTD